MYISYHIISYHIISSFRLLPLGSLRHRFFGGHQVLLFDGSNVLPSSELQIAMEFHGFQMGMIYFHGGFSISIRSMAISGT